jgi:hypothetical protein
MSVNKYFDCNKRIYLECAGTFKRQMFLTYVILNNCKIQKRTYPVVRVYTVSVCTVHNTHAQQAKICRHNTDNINKDTHIGTRYVILAKHWMWLPDDGFM